MSNQQLTEMLDRVGCTNKGLAARVRGVASRHGVVLKCDHVTVRRWRDGTQPRPQTALFIAEALSEKGGFPVSASDIGMGSQPTATPDSLTLLSYPAELTDSFGFLTVTADQDLANSLELQKAAVISTAWSGPLMSWLLARPDAIVEQPTGRRVGMAEVEAICSTIKLFMRMDFQFGGGHARAALAQYFRSDVLPLLAGSFSESTGRRLFSAAAEVAQLLGWTAYDLGRHGLAQRYLIQALRLSQAGDDRVMGARILANMSHQANYLGKHSEAAQLARAAQEGAKGVATPTVATNSLAMEARAHAGHGDERAAAAVLREAEAMFARRNIADDPPWISYFDESELAGEAAHCFRDLRRPDLAHEFIQRAVETTDPTFLRTLSFIRLVHAASCLHRPDVDQAAAVAVEAVALAGSLKSMRYKRYVSDLIADFAPYQSSADAVRAVGVLSDALAE